MQNPEIIYDKSKRAILANGDTVVDLSSVKNGATAILHSKVTEEDKGFEVTFRFETEEGRPFCLDFPFCLGFAYLSPVTLIKAIIENRLQLNGLEYSPYISEVYNIVKSWTVDNIFSSNDFPSPLTEH